MTIASRHDANGNCPTCHQSMVLGSRPPTPPEEIDVLAVLRRVDRFIRNGIELRYIRMPTCHDDPASEIPDLVERTIAAMEADPSHRAAPSPTPEGFSDSERALACNAVLDRANGLWHLGISAVLAADLSSVALEAVEAVRNAPRSSTPEDDGWIAYPDRCPPDQPCPPDDETWPTTYLTMPHYRQVNYFDGAWRYFDNDKDAWRLCVPYVTHWRPLPPPPNAADNAPRGEG